MLVYGKNVAERILRDKKTSEKVRKIYFDRNFYLKNQNLLGEFSKSRLILKGKCDLDKLANGVHQGIILDMAEYQYKTLDDVLTTDNNFILILDHIVDPHNLGAIIRTAVAAGVKTIIIPKDRQVLVNSTVVKTSVGTLFDIDIVLVTNIVNTIKRLQDEGFFIYGSSLDGKDYSLVDYASKVGLIIGNEEKGIGQLVKKSCDELITIPMSNKLDSLNASVAAGIMIYEVVRHRK